ncbi:outer membrane lipoprotein-sorting protein [Ammoniphilus resinae]|uniref:Outer membrane lipoprotein-sorting protein n=1 Tax=Ammoniphilus resinae TaxID=861532 RepID=A0ABS4GIE8_9BACL|nr:outer membrane lipoprotein-sorting protein [Ammoniphilus resinae]MBP1930031.1 outer membrane lipoprotein-sorting protein [Ammoniphilus resinae]
MIKRKLHLFILLAAIFALLVGCGPKGVEDVVGDLDKRMEKMTGYKMNAVLTLQTGKDPQSYNVEVWHKKPDNYRVALTSEERDITQIILRNEEGVFVLTPHLKKSFRFQSGWPENHGQVYLYESLIKSILDDDARVFSQVDGKYIFEVKADYQNRSLDTQKVWLNEDLSPVRVEVMDTNKNVMVGVDFTNFELDSKFDEDSFNKEKNMETSMLLQSIPTLGGVEKEAPAGSFGVIQPSYMPQGVSLTSVEKVKGQEGSQIVLRYKGDFNYTLFEERPKAATVTLPMGEIVDLDGTMAVLTGDQKKTLTWTYNGVEYLLTGDMPKEEMIAVAKSTFDQVGK